MTFTLNQGQEDAAEGFFRFLLSDEKEMIISGPGGVGKTFLMGHMIDKIMPRYFETCKLMSLPIKYDGVEMTATTNKASEVISVGTQRPASTIHSFLNLKVTEDHFNGATKLAQTSAWKVHEKKIIFVDECSMIDSHLRKFLQDGTLNCKIVYVGDHCQLAPVTETLSPIYRENLPFFELKEQMRNSGQPALMKLCEQLRNTVETGEFLPIQTVPGVIDHLDDDQMEQQIKVTFATQTQESRILAYTNNRVNQYNSHIRQVRSLGSEFSVGEYLVNSSGVFIGKTMLSAAEEIEIVSQSKKTTLEEITPESSLEVRHSTIQLRSGGRIEKVPVPVNRDHYAALIKYFGKVKNWKAYFQLKGKFPDFRPRDASTVHKSQGSTYDSVFIDLTDISTCHNADQVARMLYVACSRPRHRIFLYGKLAEKYGGTIT